MNHQQTLATDRFAELAANDPSEAPVTLPSYIAVEGPIGVGKTSLAKRLAGQFDYDTLLEQPELNPFLERFYQDPRGAALPTQLHFLFQRAKQLEELRQGDMFQHMWVADFVIEKDPLFAQVTLDDDELRIYQQVYQQLTIDAPKPDLVVYLQAPTEVLLDRIEQRGTESEQHIDPEYLARLNDAYTRFFYYYDQSPLLIVNAADINPIDNQDDFDNLVSHLSRIKSGRHYFNPQASL
ncbi:deoxynucleoside kinase [Porticoccus sp. GXU_MW_L64]